MNRTTHAPQGREWRSQAACLGTDPELFYPAAEIGPVHDAQVAAAKAVCARCPVVAACLVGALARIPYGVAGGLTEDERRTLRRRDRQTVAAVARAVTAAQKAATVQDGGQAA